MLAGALQQDRRTEQTKATVDGGLLVTETIAEVGPVGVFLSVSLSGDWQTAASARVVAEVDTEIPLVFHHPCYGGH